MRRRRAERRLELRGTRARGRCAQQRRRRQPAKALGEPGVHFREICLDGGGRLGELSNGDVPERVVRLECFEPNGEGGALVTVRREVGCAWAHRGDDTWVSIDFGDDAAHAFVGLLFADGEGGDSVHRYR